MITTTHDEKQAHHYDSIYAQGYSTRNYYPLYEQVIRMIERDGGLHRILEIGCGIGDLGKMILAQGHEYRGFDFSPVAVEQSRSLCPEADFRVGDAYDADCFQPHNYDTVVALEVLEHLDDFKAIENIPVGVRLIASVPDYDDIAHLRLYKDPQRDILERFKPILRVTDILSLTGTGHGGEQKTIFLFQGMRIETSAVAEAGTEFSANAESRHSLNLVSPATSTAEKVGRNNPCPCGSGRKYKKCCLV